MNLEAMVITKRVTKKSVERVDNIVGSYAYDKKAQNLYVITPSSNIVITLTKDYAKIIKKNKSIPQVAEEKNLMYSFRNIANSWMINILH